MADFQIYVTIGLIFAVVFVLGLYFSNYFFRQRLKQLEQRMLENMIKVIERYERGEFDERAQKKGRK